MSECWQLDQTQFALRNPDWQVFVGQLVQKIEFFWKLGREGTNFHAELSQLVLYEAGGTLPDSGNSEPGVFGEVVIALPSYREGGKLLVQHRFSEREFFSSGPDS
jgi:hypothetical protein